MPFRAKLSSAIDIYLRSDHHTDAMPAHRHLVTLICHLIDTISVICMHCGDFIAGKIQKDIFPQISRLLQKFSLISTDIKESDQELVLCIFIHIKKLFSNIRTAVALLAIVPTLTGMILPFLANNGLIGDSAYEAFATVLVVDFDSSLRYLYDISGIGIPERVFLPHKQMASDDTMNNHNSTLRRRCLALIVELETKAELQLLI